MPRRYVLDPAELDYTLAPPAGYLFAIKGGRASEANWLYMTALGPDRQPWQGDFIPDGRMVWLAEDGVVVEYHGPLVLTSHGCDTDAGRDPYATVAPALEFDSFLDEVVRRATKPGDDPEQVRRAQHGALVAQSIRNAFYYPAAFGNAAHVVDFNFLGSVENRVLMEQFLAADPARRIRLSENGHRLFACKLTGHFARAEERKDYPRT